MLHRDGRLELAKVIKMAPALPPDDPKRTLILAQPDHLPHIGLVGDAYTITVPGEATDGRFCVIDMHVPPGGGPPPHRHDFEKTFILLEGEIEATFRGEKSIVRAGETVHIPANAPHHFHNSSAASVRMLCICCPAGQGEVLLKGWGASRYAHGAPAEAEFSRAGRLYRESQIAGAGVPNRAPERGLRRANQSSDAWLDRALLMASGTARHAGSPPTCRQKKKVIFRYRKRCESN
jgi:quercetin dioxygenase-like cupin family protein